MTNSWKTLRSKVNSALTASGVLENLKTNTLLKSNFVARVRSRYGVIVIDKDKCGKALKSD